jgi:hypothetical protein
MRADGWREAATGAGWTAGRARSACGRLSAGRAAHGRGLRIGVGGLTAGPDRRKVVRRVRAGEECLRAWKAAGEPELGLSGLGRGERNRFPEMWPNRRLHC